MWYLHANLTWVQRPIKLEVRCSYLWKVEDKKLFWYCLVIKVVHCGGQIGMIFINLNKLTNLSLIICHIYHIFSVKQYSSIPEFLSDFHYWIFKAILNTYFLGAPLIILTVKCFKSPSAHPPWLAMVIVVGDLQEVWRKGNIEVCLYV